MTSKEDRKSAVSRDQIKHLGWLSRIDLTEAELEKYTAQIEGIIGYLDKLDSISLAETDPVGLKKQFSELREDVSVPFEGESIGTTYRKEGFVKGPRMV